MADPANRLTGGDSQQLNDLWGVYMEQELSHGGQLNDQQFEWLASLGYSGALVDRFYSFWTDPRTLP